MTLIKSISGIRGTIGGAPGDNLTPVDLVECTAAYATWLLMSQPHAKVVIGRDARVSGEIVSGLVSNTLRSMGVNVVDLGLSTTPTVEKAVVWEVAQGGIILTASHNGRSWNALKFLNSEGEFISPEDGETIIGLALQKNFDFVGIDRLGSWERREGMIEKHIQHCLGLPHVDAEKVRSKSFKVAVDAINSTGSISIAPLLESLGCEVILLHDDLSGQFAHNPEPLPAHLETLAEVVRNQGCDLGVAVDPDVDRLAFVCEDGSMFGEEYTIVACAEHILSHEKGSTVSNLSSTKALEVVTEKHGGTYHAAAVGEVNVVRKMKATNAIFGGEGNGGVIYPASHYGRDALVGVALFLTLLAERGLAASQMRSQLPDYHIAKMKVALTADFSPDQVLEKMSDKHQDSEQLKIDGLKLLLGEEWVHMRKSNTEPIIRVYAESSTMNEAEALAIRFVDEIKHLARD